MQYSLGYLPDKPDVRDHLFDAAPLRMGEASKAASCSNLLGAPFDQGNLGSCVAQAVTKLLFASHKRQGIEKPIVASRLALYYLARSRDGSQLYDAGTSIRQAFKALNQWGFAKESAWPYQIDKFAAQPSTQYLRAAYDQHSPTNYWSIIGDGADRLWEIRLAISNGLPVAFGTNVTESFANGEIPLEGAPIYRPDISEKIVGGHAMVIGGYAGDVFYVLNSWGENFGDGGWCTMHEDYITWDYSRDFWVVENVPSYSRKKK